MKCDHLLAEAIANLENLKPGEKFVVKDLFVGSNWKALSRGDKLHFGRVFKNQVKEGSIPGVQYIGKAANNSAQYEKTEEN